MFAALTGQKVITDMFSAGDSAPANVESAIEHIAVAQRIDLLLVAPATADILGKFAHGKQYVMVRLNKKKKKKITYCC